MKKKILFVCFWFLYTSVLAQTEPIIVFNSGSILGNTVEQLNEQDFAFKIDWNQGPNDTIKCEFIHGRNNAPIFQTHQLISGTTTDFYKKDIRSLKPGDILVFKLEKNGETYLKTYNVLSTASSMNHPYFIDFYFLFNGDTLATDKYKIYKSDSLTIEENGITARIINDLAGEENKYFIRFRFDNSVKLPKNLQILFDKEWLQYELLGHYVYHGVATISYSSKNKLRRKDYLKEYFNSKIHVSDLDSGREYSISSRN